MNTDLGKVITAIVTDQTDSKSYVQKSGITYVVVSDKQLALGEAVKGLAYVDKNNRLSFTTEIPQIRFDEFGWGEVVEVRKDLGVFVNTGLPNKDIVVSLDDLPSLRHLWPKKNDKLYLSLTVDKEDRLWGKLANEDIFETMANEGKTVHQNNDIAGYTYLLKKSGTYVYTDDHFIAFIHPSERDQEPRLGQYVEGRVIGNREDGVLYMSLQPRAHEVLDDGAQMLYTVILKSENQSISFTDKSDPEDIKNYFGISKGQFKRAVGRLMKRGLVIQTDKETKLKKDE